MSRLLPLLSLLLLGTLGCRSIPQADLNQQWWANLLLEFNT